MSTDAYKEFSPVRAWQQEQLSATAGWLDKMELGIKTEQESACRPKITSKLAKSERTFSITRHDREKLAQQRTFHWGPKSWIKSLTDGCATFLRELQKSLAEYRLCSSTYSFT
jgi:hypothetical protein